MAISTMMNRRIGATDVSDTNNNNHYNKRVERREEKATEVGKGIQGSSKQSKSIGKTKAKALPYLR